MAVNALIKFVSLVYTFKSDASASFSSEPRSIWKYCRVTLGLRFNVAKQKENNEKRELFKDRRSVKVLCYDLSDYLNYLRVVSLKR